MTFGLRADSSRASAHPVVFAATRAEADPQTFIGPTPITQSRGSPGYIKLPKAALDRNLRDALWQRGEALTRVRFNFS